MPQISLVPVILAADLTATHGVWTAIGSGSWRWQASAPTTIPSGAQAIISLGIAISSAVANGAGFILDTVTNPLGPFYSLNTLPYNGILTQGGNFPLASEDLNGSIRFNTGVGFLNSVNKTWQWELSPGISLVGPGAPNSIASHGYLPGPAQSNTPTPSLFTISALHTLTATIDITGNIVITNPSTQWLAQIVGTVANTSGCRYNFNYILWSTQITITPTSAAEGQTVTVNDGANGLLLVNNIQIGSTSLVSPTITLQTASQIQFIVPTGFTGIVPIWATLISTSQTILLGYFSIANYSGLYGYAFSPPGHDQFYDRSTTPPTTIGIKIPNPTIKTGFISEDSEDYYE